MGRRGGARLAAALARVRDALSFSPDVRRLADSLNRVVELPERLEPPLPSHPAGFQRLVRKRRLTMAEAYLRVVADARPEASQARLAALRLLVHLASHAKTLAMPLNTARVQVALMKEAVKAANQRTRQLELMSDFACASYGRPAVIRRVLSELGLIEVPEVGKPLRDLGLGWDDHVHDVLSEGRKTPSQLVLDAFIKGMSHLTVAYYDLADEDAVSESIEAGDILGVRVRVGVEFSAGPERARLHFMWVPPQESGLVGLRQLLDEHSEGLHPFWEALASNAQRRSAAVAALLEHFNATYLVEFNDRFPEKPYLHVKPLQWEALRRRVPGGHVTRLHLAQLLWEALVPVQHRRVLMLRNQWRHARERHRRGRLSGWELSQVEQRHALARRRYAELTPLGVLRTVTAAGRWDYDSALSEVGPTLELLTACGGETVFIHPLSQGMQAALDTLVAHHASISAVEVFNMVDAADRDPAVLRRFAELVALLRSGRPERVAASLSDWGLQPPSAEALAAACDWYAEHPLSARCGSDSVGRASRVPGMGFVAAHSLSRAARRQVERRGARSLPPPVVALLPQGSPAQGRRAERAAVHMLGSTTGPSPNPVGDEPPPSRLSPRRVWRYLNINLRGLLKVAVGVVPAVLVVGPRYAALWLFITGLRNVLVDLLSSSGLALRSWRLSSVDRDNLADSLLWTGFSVPLLAWAKDGFDWGWALAGGPEGVWQTVAKFWVIAFTNGLYISSHNRVRGFEPRVVRANFLRSVLSWPLAALGSALLTPLGVPAIVQAKIWSDVVAGVVEGSSKLLRRLRLAQRDISEILLALLRPERKARLAALADILYSWAHRHQGRWALGRLLTGKAAKGPLEQGDTLERARACLARRFGGEGTMEALTGLMLEHASSDEVLPLCDLVSDHYESCSRWVGRRLPSKEAPCGT